ncbi:uncharacterized protein PV07_01437 [Cladophialophora immunda]|uniref:Transcription factor domain-containing protein n=1 Tax=Cladophialophora immunda TaxID=569365 RepID=A0A0D2CXP9_9EURO|nr:uncharacterized protein PV07_01437 [Cladophialophora immunda]KIW34670.1 hypothetical protein PV07_01437 [Cladophialophora immunda]
MPLSTRCSHEDAPSGSTINPHQVPESQYPVPLSAAPDAISEQTSDTDVLHVSPPPNWTTTAQPTFQTNASAGYCRIPHALALDLTALYFSHAYNASLLLHQETFLAEVRAGAANPHVLLSVCAFASKFYRGPSGYHSLTEAGFGREWARSAESMVAAELGEPREENIVTYINLALYWYSEGAWRKSFIYKWNGVQIAYVLGIPAGRQEPNAKPLDVEVRRRRFWACACMMLFGSKADFAMNNFSQAAARLRTPCPESQFQAMGKTNASVVRSSEPSIYAVLIDILMIWNDIYYSVKNGNNQLDNLQTLHSRVEAWNSSIPGAWRFTPTLLDSSATHLPFYILLHILYHQSLCTLHSSIVPLFSWGHSEPGLNFARQTSAQEAFERACSVSTCLKAILQSSLSPDRIPSFVGYAAYASCAVQIPFRWCTDPVVRARVSANLVANLKIMQQMGLYWRFISLLCTNVMAIYSTVEKDRPDLHGEPKVLTPNQLCNRYGHGRAHTSILSHNEIVWNRGSMAERDAEIVDLGLQPSESQHGAISSLIEEVSKNSNPASPPGNPLLMLEPNMFDSLPDYSTNEYLVPSEQVSSFDYWLDQFDAEIDFNVNSKQ